MSYYGSGISAIMRFEIRDLKEEIAQLKADNARLLALARLGHIALAEAMKTLDVSYIYLLDHAQTLGLVSLDGGAKLTDIAQLPEGSE